MCVGIARCNAKHVAEPVAEREVTAKVGERGATSAEKQPVVDCVANATANGREPSRADIGPHRECIRVVGIQRAAARAAAQAEGFDVPFQPKDKIADLPIVASFKTARKTGWLAALNPHPVYRRDISWDKPAIVTKHCHGPRVEIPPRAANIATDVEARPIIDRYRNGSLVIKIGSSRAGRAR